MAVVVTAHQIRERLTELGIDAERQEAILAMLRGEGVLPPPGEGAKGIFQVLPRPPMREQLWYYARQEALRRAGAPVED